MKCILLKASNSKYIKLIDVDSISLLVHKFGTVIVGYNDNFKDAHVFMDYYGLDEKKANQCAKTEIQVMIYDDYIE